MTPTAWGEERLVGRRNRAKLSGGGTSGNGTVFKVDTTTKKETVLYSFTGGADGGDPVAALIVDANGNLYGTTSGVPDFNGTVFKLSY